MRRVYLCSTVLVWFLGKIKKWLYKKKPHNILNHGPESERDGSTQGQTQGQEKGHDGSCCLRLVWRHLPADGKEGGLANERKQVLKQPNGGVGRASLTWGRSTCRDWPSIRWRRRRRSWWWCTRHRAQRTRGRSDADERCTAWREGRRRAATPPGREARCCPCPAAGKNHQFSEFARRQAEKVALLDRKPLLCCVQKHFLWLTGYYLNQH